MSKTLAAVHCGGLGIIKAFCDLVADVVQSSVCSVLMFESMLIKNDCSVSVMYFLLCSVWVWHIFKDGDCIHVNGLFCVHVFVKSNDLWV